MKKLTKNIALLSAGLATAGALGTVSADAAKYKTIRWSQSDILSSMDPSKTTTNIDFNAINATGDGLYRANQKGDLVLSAADSVEESEDGLTYTFKLKPDLKWSNGDPLTAHDFVYGWQRTNDPKTASQYAYLYSGIKNADAIQKGDEKDLSKLGVKALDDQTLQVELEKPMPQLKSVLANAPFFPQNEKFVKHAGKKYGTAAKYTLSSGPYKMKKWSGSSDTYTLVKNKNYYDADVVKTPKIKMATVKEQNTGYNLYKSNKLDYTTLSPEQVKKSKNTKAYRTIPEATTAYLQLNEKKVKAFKNTKVRQAFSYAIDRETFADKILTGSATPAKTFTATKLVKDPNTGKDFAKSAAVKGVNTYNLKKAQKLLKQGMKEAGVKKIKVQMLTDDISGAKRSAQFVQSQYEKLDGVKVTIKTVPFKQRINLSEKRDFDMVVSLWGADYADPSTFLDLYKSDSSFNEGGWKNKEYDQLLDDAANKNVNDPKARFKDLTKAEQILDKEAGLVPLYYRSQAALQRTSIKHMVTNTSGATFDWKWAYKK